MFVKMEVKRFFIIMCLFAVVVRSSVSKKVKSKPEQLEDTYGDLVDDDVQNDEYDYDTGDSDASPDDGNDLEGEEEPVEFKTQPQTFIVNIGDTIRLPCEVSNQETINTWQRDDLLLYQGHVAFDLEKYPNILEFPNNTLEVKINSEKDYGNYACIMITSNVAENRPRIIHKVVQPSPPKILGIYTENNKTEYKPGETLTLTCKATGYPKPTISWHKENERLMLEGESITIESLTEDNEGIYRCLADNHVQKPDHHHISIFIEHPPKITIGKYLVTSNKEKDAELICTVDAYPEARVTWKKGDEVLKTDDNRRIQIKRRQQHIVESIMVITNLTDNDFTTYTCSATNSMGKKKELVKLVKIPAVREFVKPEKNNKDVVLTWKVESKSPISAHEIQYRKKGDDDWKVAEPEVTNSLNDIYTVKYTLKDLDAGAYETRVRSKNEHGWSEYSDIMPFEGVLAKQGSTAYHKNHHKKHHKEKEIKEKHTSSVQEATTSAPQQQEISQKEAPVGESKPLSGTSIKSSAAILSIALIFLFYVRQ